MRIAILGCGPSGLLAAYACKREGHNVTIFSRDRNPSLLTGAQYIHEPIPGLTTEQPDGVVIFHKTGTAEGYARKVYGRPDAPTSWSIFPEGPRPMWSMLKVYQKLFQEWHSSIQLVDIENDWLNYLEGKRDMYPLVISSIPCPIICRCGNHEFPKVEVTFESHDHQDPNLGEHYIVYSGEEKDPWYRSSHVGGLGWSEYGGRYTGKFATGKDRNLRFGIKPLNTNCDCRPRMIRVGRFGQWRKGVLVHHSYRKTIDALEVTRKVLAVPEGAKR